MKSLNLALEKEAGKALRQILYRGLNSIKSSTLCVSRWRKRSKEASITSVTTSRKVQQTAGDGTSNDLLRRLAKAINDKKQLLNELLTISLAGRGTTASLLSILFFTPAKKPDIWQRLKAEVDHLKDDIPNYEQLKEMRYTNHCSNESK